VSSPQPDAQAPADGQTWQGAQAAIALAVAAAVAQLWPTGDPAKVRTPAFKAAVAQQVIAHAQASATLAVQQYTHQRRLAAVGAGSFRPVAADTPDLAEIARMVDEALAGVDLTDPEAEAEVQANLGAAAGRLATDTGAATVMGNVGADRAARGYARVPEGGACSFCLMLATRGPVYKHERSRGRGDSFAASNAKFTGAGTIKVHDHCDCHPEPVFGAYEAPARVRAADALYAIASEGRSGKRARDAYRAAIEGFTNDAAGTPYFTDDQLKRIAPLRAQLTT
jgi:hypothetical protein